MCLIVDHPDRDLEGLVRVACELGRRGVETFLVPMYEMQEALLLKPSLVVVNYVRFANASFLDVCARAGIPVAVLDTEGGVRRDMRALAAEVEPYLGRVRLYCVWGRQQFDALRPGAARSGVELRVTGCPRYDFAAPRWRDAIRDVDPGTPRVLLVDTNFPLVNPRFSTVAGEVAQRVERLGMAPDYVRDLVEQSRHAQAELVKATSGLAVRFPHCTVVLRPHPFEARGPYEQWLGHHGNVRVIQSGSVLEWIRKAIVVVHHNCSTAIEACLMGKEPLFTRWIEAPLLEQPSSVAVSHKVGSLRELESVVEQALASGTLPVPDELRVSRLRIIEDFFHANDGRAGERVADAIAEVLGAEASGSRRPYVRALLGKEGGWVRRLQRLLLLAGGLSVYRAVRRGVRSRRGADAKGFDVAQVRDTLARLGRVDAECGRLAARATTRAMAFLPVPGRYASVRVAGGTGTPSVDQSAALAVDRAGEIR